MPSALSHYYQNYLHLSYNLQDLKTRHAKNYILQQLTRFIRSLNVMHSHKPFFNKI
jgi:hypothetical protein